jgi:hypothetical protein
MSDVTTTGFGAYGLRLTGTIDPELLNSPVPDGWPAVEIAYRQGRDDAEVTLDEKTASYPCGDAGSVVADRASSTVTVTAPEPVPADELTHPYLAWCASAYARWLGREAFHAGGVVAGDGVWAVTGDRGHGKSTLLAAAAASGMGVVSDDLLVIDGTTAYAGPRCVDLRDEAAAYLGVGAAISSAGRERHRVRLPTVPAEAPLRGWVMLSWGDEHSLVPVRPAEGLVRLGRQRMSQLHEVRPEGLLDLAAMPIWELRRPRALGELGRSLELLAGLG